MPPLHILLVDDNDELRSATTEQLESAGHRVVEARHGAGALEWIQSATDQAGADDLDVLISDVRMPGMDGVALAARARALRASLPILLVSSHLDADLETRLAGGDIAFCAKPYGRAELLAGIDRARAASAMAAAAASAGPARLNKAPRRTAALRRPASLAVAAVVAAAIGLGALLLVPVGPPELPAPLATEVTRSFRVEPLLPRGELAASPGELQWRSHESAIAYRVSILRLDRELVWDARVVDSPAVLPGAVAAALDPAVLYTWRVEALDADDQRIAWSEGVRFRITPSVSSSTEGSP